MCELGDTCTARTLAPGAHLPDLLHLRMRLAAQRQVQVSKSRAAPGSAGVASQRMLAMIYLVYKEVSNERHLPAP